MKSFRDNEERGKWAKIGLSLIIVTTIILTISNAFQLELLLRWNNGAEVDLDEADMNDSRQWIIVIGYYMFRIVGGITFVLWFRRAYFNLHQKLKTLEFGEGWAAGSWFVPFVNLVRPYKIMKELFTESSFWLKMKGVEGSKSQEQLILPWWILWILTTVLGRIVDKLPSETVDELIELTQFAIGAGIVETIAGLLAFKLINSYIKREQLMMEVEKQLAGQADSIIATAELADNQGTGPVISPSA
ncbi:DUF4328 domain-containing protein [Algoriphagus resistens]|uniref:DUF4328 domain-containing protein n=1 Tax=Algoriphagus resistens TaxID=1750590 RepID=UPI000716A58B|nr:DUF4328 domain-containing protein [Algoriphagus resistens]